ncbi:unnamed protein product, partial [Hapterophycus canaliculatus]
QLASKKHRESASYLYDGVGHGGGSSSAKANTRDRNNRYNSRHKVRRSFSVRMVYCAFAPRAKDGGVSDGCGEARSENLLDITGAPGVEFLAPAERLLCSQLHLLPGYYMVIKEAMIQECARAGCLKKNNISGLAVLD